MKPYNHHCRNDKRPILGNTPEERMARLWRLREAIVAAGWDDLRANRYARENCNVIAIELLTAEEATALIALLDGLTAPQRGQNEAGDISPASGQNARSDDAHRRGSGVATGGKGR